MLRFLQQSGVGEQHLSDLKNKTQILFLDWGDQNLKTPKTLRQLSRLLGNAEIERIAIPRSAHIMTKARFRDFSNLYRAYLEKRTDIRKAFLFSYEGHYSLLALKLEATGASVSIFEDGLGMYVHGLENNRVKITGILGTINHASRRLIGSILSKESDASLARKLIRWLREIYWGIFGPEIPNQDLLRSGFRNFTNSYSSFPELAAKLFPHANQVFVPFAEAMLDEELRAKDIKKAVPLLSGDTLFLAQTYLFADNELRKILKTALKLTSKNLWIKLHPRTDKEMVRQFKRAAKNIDEKRIRFCDFKAPAENLINALKPKKVISLTSTSLTYVQQLSKSSEPISLADFALELMAKSTDRKTQRTRDTLAADRAVLQYFPEVKIYSKAKN